MRYVLLALVLTGCGNGLVKVEPVKHTLPAPACEPSKTALIAVPQHCPRPPAAPECVCPVHKQCVEPEYQLTPLLDEVRLRALVEEYRAAFRSCHDHAQSK